MGRTYDATYLQRLNSLLTTTKSQGYAWLDCKPGEVVVDIGCGLGFDSAALAKSGAQVLGLDRNEVLLTQAKEAYGNLVKFEHQTAEATGLVSSTVDKLRFDRVLQHIADHAPVLDEAYRILKPGGVIQITDTDNLSLSYFLPDPRLERKLVDAVAARVVGSYELRLLPDRLRRLRFGPVRLAVHQLIVDGFDEAEYVIGVDEILHEEAAKYGVTEPEMAVWREWKQSGRCYLAVNLVMLQAIKES